MGEGDSVGAAAGDAARPGGAAAVDEEQSRAVVAGDRTTGSWDDAAVAAEGTDILAGAIEVEGSTIVDVQGAGCIKQGVVASGESGGATVEGGGAGVELAGGDVEIAAQALGQAVRSDAGDRSRGVFIELGTGHVRVGGKGADDGASQIQGGTSANLDDGFTASGARGDGGGDVDRSHGDAGGIQGVVAAGDEDAAAADAQGEVTGYAG